MPKKPKNWFVEDLEDVTKELRKVRADRVGRVLYGAFTHFAFAGDVARSGELLDAILATARTSTGKHGPDYLQASVFVPHLVDVVSHAAKLGDRKGGEGSHASRVRAGELMARWWLTQDSWSGTAIPKEGSWLKKEDARARQIDHWRYIQALARPADGGDDAKTEKKALESFEAYEAAWRPDERGAGGGRELVLGLDLALRHGREDLARTWRDRHAHRFAESFEVEAALTLPALARAAFDGWFSPVVAIGDAERASLYEAIMKLATSRAAETPAAKQKSVPKVQKRVVDASYSQFYLEHLGEEEVVEYFQDKRESAQGMSIFPTRVGIATPSDTLEVAVEVAVTPKPSAVPKVVQAVAFPFTVRGPLVLRSVADDDFDEAIVVPPGRYDVSVQFALTPSGGAKRVKEADSLRVFKAHLDFCPEGACDAPRCLRLEDGRVPPKRVFAHR